MAKLQASADCPIRFISIGPFPAIHITPGTEVEVADSIVDTVLATGHFIQVTVHDQEAVRGQEAAE